MSRLVIATKFMGNLYPGDPREAFLYEIGAIRQRCPETTIEVLTPDFLRKEGCAEIVAKAKNDAEALVARRQRMAEDKIAAEELAAVKRLRASAADASVKAAARIISERLDPAADERIVDRTIGELAGR